MTPAMIRLRLIAAQHIATHGEGLTKARAMVRVQQYREELKRLESERK